MNSLARPIFWIVAGLNGSGKSSLYGNSEISTFDHSVWIINPKPIGRKSAGVIDLDPDAPGFIKTAIQNISGLAS